MSDKKLDDQQFEEGRTAITERIDANAPLELPPIEVEGCRVHPLGDRAAPPLLLISLPPEPEGFGRGLAEALAARFFVLFVPRLDAPGRSARLSDLAQRGAAILRAVTRERAVAVGLGFGGEVALRLAAADPAALRALFAVNSLHPGCFTADRGLSVRLAEATAYVADLLDPSLPRRAAARDPEAEALLSSFWAADRGAADRALAVTRALQEGDHAERVHRLYAENFSWSEAPGRFTAQDVDRPTAFGRRVAAIREGAPRHMVLPREGGAVPMVETPTFWLYTGARGVPAEAADPGLLRRFLPHPRVERWPEADQGVAEAAPAVVAAQIESFIDDVLTEHRLAREAERDRGVEAKDSRHIVEQYDKKIRDFRAPEAPLAGKALRGSHPKTHGVVSARLVVRPDLEEELQVGLFAEPGRAYPALLRFSSLGKPQLGWFHDRDPDVRGVGLKLLEAPPVRGEEAATHTLADLLLNVVPILSTRRGRDVVPQDLDFMKLEHLLRYAEELVVPDLLAASYYSQTPYRYGPGRAVKYRLRPRPLPPGATVKVDESEPRFLRSRLEAALRGATSDVLFDLLIQPQTDPVRDPIEDPRVQWTGPERVVATLHIPPQAINAPEDRARDEQLSFHLFHVPQAHAPMGAVNRSRRAVYDSSPALRNQLNQATARLFPPRAAPRRVAIVGGGASGLTAALALATHGHAVTVIEHKPRLGGHAQSVELEDGHSVDPGFGSFTGGAYPNVLRLMDTLGVETEALGSFKEAETFFSLDGKRRWRRIEDITVHRSVLEEAARFDPWAVLEDEQLDFVTARAYFERMGFSEAFIHYWFLGSMIFVFVGHPADYYLDYPIRELVRYCYLPVVLAGREPVLRAKRGSGAYIDRFRQRLSELGVEFHTGTRATALRRDARGVRLSLEPVTEREGAPAHPRREADWDELILAVAPHRALEVLGATVDPEERALLGAFQHTVDTAVVHRDPRLMPRDRAGWAHGNTIVPDEGEVHGRERAFHFTKWALCNKDRQTDVFSTYAYNRDLQPKGGRRVAMEHVKVTPEVVRLRRQIEARQGLRSTTLCGSWLRAFTLHEDAVVTGLQAANRVMAGLQEYPVVQPYTLDRPGARVPWGERHTILDVLVYQAQVAGTRPALTFLGPKLEPEAALRHGEVWERSRAIAEALRGRWGLSPGDRALLVYLPGVDFVLGLLGCLIAGVVPVPIYPPDPSNLKYDLDKIRSIATASGARHALSTRPYRRMTQVGTIFSPLSLFKWPKDLAWHTTDDLPAVASGPLPAWNPGPDDLAFLQFTSGSTADPKGVMISHGNLMHQLRVAAQALQIDGDTVGVCWVPQYHDLGLIGGIFNALYSGAHYVFTSPLTFLADPSSWGEMLHRYKATATASPDFGYRLLARRSTPEQRARWDWSALRQVMSAGEPVSWETVRDFTHTFASTGLDPAAFQPAYGLAEHVVAVTMNGSRLFHLDKVALQLEGRIRFGTTRVVGCGKPPESVRVAIIHPETRHRADPDEVGEIWVSSPSRALGYWGRPEESAATFAARIEGEGEGEGETYLRTGDLGFLHHGELFITGRAKDLIILRGRNIAPVDVERAAEGAHKALRPGCSAAFVVEGPEGERLVLVAELRERRLSRGEADSIAAAVRREVMKAEGVRVAELSLLEPRSLPKTTSGKVRRRECARRYREGALLVVERVAGESAAEVAAGPPIGGPIGGPLGGTLGGNSAGVEALILFALFEVTRKELDPDRPVGEQVDLDSIEALDLVNLLRERLGVDLPVTALAEHKTVRALSAWVRARPDARLPDPALVTLHRGGESGGPPLILVHPAGGGLSCYLDLAHRWQGSLFGLQQLAPAASVGELAARYIAALPAEATAGPLLLGGYSFGGTVAREMAEQLEAAGRSVLGFIAIDELHEEPAEIAASPYGPELGVLLTVCRERLPAADTREMLALLRRGPLSIEAAVASIADRELQAAVGQEVRQWLENARLSAAHRPSHTFSGPSALLATASCVNHHQSRFGRVLPIPGGHFDTLRPPHVDAVVEALFAAIEGFGGPR
jgi:acyl-CoA synthetase (AMP-forming)/AMP-acid ligase II/predicted NAD/FAD-binding protein/thioesterase domain-containing protein/acyl carrier protein